MGTSSSCQLNCIHNAENRLSTEYTFEGIGLITLT